MQVFELIFRFLFYSSLYLIFACIWILGVGICLVKIYDLWILKEYKKMFKFIGVLFIFIGFLLFVISL